MRCLECAGDTVVGVVVLPKKRKAPFEDLDPGFWGGSCNLEVEDFQDVLYSALTMC